MRQLKSCESGGLKSTLTELILAVSGQTVDTLLGRGHAPASACIDVEAFRSFFSDKVAKVRLSTESAPPPTFSRVRAGVMLDAFIPLNSVTFWDAIGRLPDKSSDADPMPTSVLKQTADLLAP